MEAEFIGTLCATAASAFFASYLGAWAALATWQYWPTKSKPVRRFEARPTPTHTATVEEIMDGEKRRVHIANDRKAFMKEIEKRGLILTEQELKDMGM